MLKRLWGRILCRFMGHRRGKLSAQTYDAKAGVWHKAFQCPRCGATWARTIKAAEPKP